MNVPGCHLKNGWCARRKGVILLSVAWCILILALLLTSRIRREEMAFAGDRASQINTNLDLCARSTESMFLAALSTDVSLKTETSYDAPSDAWGWARIKEKFGQDLETSYPDITLGVEIEDEGGKINPVKASPETLGLLLKNQGWSDIEAQDLTQAIQDCCKPDAPPKGEAVDTRKQSEQQAFLDLRKLLSIPSFTEELLYGEDTNFSGQLDVNENDGTESMPPDDRNGQLRPGLLSFLSVWGDGKVNPNLAPLEILLTVPGVSRKIASEIVDCRCGADGVAGTRDDFVFRNAEDIKKLASVSRFMELEYRKMAPYFRMTTDTFQIRICATSKRTGQILRRQSVVRRKQAKTTILSQREDHGV